MKLYNSQKILIIDDKYDEAHPLITALAIKGIPTLYWDGGYEGVPEEPLTGVRFVFLDMRFSTVTDERTICTFLFSLLSKAISVDNGPYVLFIWSKHDNEYLDYFKKEILKIDVVPKPYLIMNMEKNMFINSVSEENEVYAEIASTLCRGTESDEDQIQEVLQLIEENIGKTKEKIQIIDDGINKIIQKLDNKLQEVNSLAILFMWERLVNESAENLLNDIASLSEVDNNWDNNIKTLIQSLASANAGRSIDRTAESYIKNSIISLNQMLSDELTNSLIKEKIDGQAFSFIEEPTINKTIDGNVYSISKIKKYIIKKNKTEYKSFKKIEELSDNIEDKSIIIELYNKYWEYAGKSNFKLLCERITGKRFKKPGGIYEVDDNELLKNICKSTLKGEYKLSDIELIKLDISSACDYAQDKLKRSRILFGILIKEEYFDSVQETEDIYKTPQLETNNEKFKILLNFHYVGNEDYSEIENGKIKFSFRELILTEIKHKLATYISRIGIINL